MPNIGFGELMVIVVIAIVFVGPRELPGLLRGIGKTMTQLRRMAGDFQRQFSQALEEAELDSVKSDIADITRDIPTARDITSNSIGAGKSTPPAAATKKPSSASTTGERAD